MVEADALAEGARLGAYVVEAELGRGAWGVVLAVHRAGGPRPGEGELALKVLPPRETSPAHLEELEAMARREARLGSEGLPGLLPTLEVSRAGDEAPALRGALLLLMPRAAASLEERLAAHDAHAPLPGGEALVRAIWAALDALHARGWVHGDVKPSNVLLDGEGEARLADFGLAVELDGTHGYGPHLGSLDHVPPEWLSERVGPQGSRIRPGRDRWALGVLAHQVLSGGRFPFDGQTARARALRAQAHATGTEPLRLDPAVPAAWQEPIRQLLAADEGERALARPPDVAAGRTARRPRRRPFALAGALVALAAAGGGVALAVSGGGSEDAASRAPRAASVPDYGGELAASAPVPRRYARLVTRAAHNCNLAEVTPSLLAAILEVESRFDPHAERPASDEFGIAMWTPRVFEDWKQDVDGGGASVRSAPDSIISLGSYLCASAPTVRDVRGPRGQVLAAVYKNGTQPLLRDRAVPPETRAYAARVARIAQAWAAPRRLRGRPPVSR